MSDRNKWIISIAIFSIAAFLVLTPEFSVITLGAKLLAFMPLLLYAVVGAFTREYLLKIPRDAVQADLDKGQAMSLTLAGFCFTSISLSFSFFKTDLEAGAHIPVVSTIFYFCFALGCFIASYMVLKFRTQNLFEYLSEAFIDNGLWCILVGLFALFQNVKGLHRSRYVMGGSIVLYCCYLILNFYHHIKYSTSANNAPVDPCQSH
jgi:hypothetical protein